MLIRAFKAKIQWVLERYLWKCIVKLFYGKYCNNPTFIPNWYIIKTYLVWQKIFRINSEVPWFVHPSSRVTNWQKIRMEESCSPGMSYGCYIQAGNGIELGRNILIGPNVGIISANHDKNDFNKWEKGPPIRIGDNVWIGMNSVILQGVEIGDNTIIGAGSVVAKNIPRDCIAAGNPCKVISIMNSQNNNEPE